MSLLYPEFIRDYYIQQVIISIAVTYVGIQILSGLSHNCPRNYRSNDRKRKKLGLFRSKDQEKDSWNRISKKISVNSSLCSKAGCREESPKISEQDQFYINLDTRQRDLNQFIESNQIDMEEM